MISSFFLIVFSANSFKEVIDSFSLSFYSIICCKFYTFFIKFTSISFISICNFIIYSFLIFNYLSFYKSSIFLVEDSTLSFCSFLFYSNCILVTFNSSETVSNVFLRIYKLFLSSSILF